MVINLQVIGSVKREAQNAQLDGLPVLIQHCCVMGSNIVMMIVMKSHVVGFGPFGKSMLKWWLFYTFSSVTMFSKLSIMVFPD